MNHGIPVFYSPYALPEPKFIQGFGIVCRGRESLERFLLNTVEPDDCCCKRLVKQLGSDKVSGDTWTCPKCGIEWKREVYRLDNGEGISHWRPNPLIALIE